MRIIQRECAPRTPPPPRGGRTERHGLSSPIASLSTVATGELSPMAFLVGVMRPRPLQDTPHPMRPATCDRLLRARHGRRRPIQAADAWPSPLVRAKAVPSTQGEGCPARASVSRGYVLRGSSTGGRRMTDDRLSPDARSKKLGAAEGGGIVRCDACPVLCRIRPGRAGACARYANDNGQLVRTDPVVLMQRTVDEGGKAVSFAAPNGTARCSTPRARSSPASAPAPPIPTTSRPPSSSRPSTPASTL